MSTKETASERPPLRGGKLAKLLGVDLKTLHNWHKRGKISARRTLGGQLIFEPASVLEDYRRAGVDVPDAFAEYVRTGVLTVTPRKRVRTTKPRAETRGAA